MINGDLIVTGTALLDTGTGGGSSISSIAFGVCTTAVNTIAKVATVNNYIRTVGSIVGLIFTAAAQNAAGSTAANPTLNVNSTGATPIFHNGVRVTGTTTHIRGLRLVYLQWDGTNWVILNSGDTGMPSEQIPMIDIDTNAATTAKTANLAGFVRREGSLVFARFVNGNTANSPTLNINNTGASRLQLPNGGWINPHNFPITPGHPCLIAFTGGGYCIITGNTGSVGMPMSDSAVPLAGSTVYAPSGGTWLVWGFRGDGSGQITSGGGLNINILAGGSIFPVPGAGSTIFAWAWQIA
jgi:hypothetical protein